MYLEIKKYDLRFLVDNVELSVGMNVGLGENPTSKEAFGYIQKIDGDIISVFELRDNRVRVHARTSLVAIFPILVDSGMVVAIPEQFGSVFNYGPPHDHNADWKYDNEGEQYTYLEQYLPSSIHRAVYNDMKLCVVVEEICPHYGGSHIGKDCSCKSGFVIRPKLLDGKIILDGYGLIEKRNILNYFH